MANRKIHSIICEHCGKSFVSEKCNRKFCCKECVSAHRKEYRTQLRQYALEDKLRKEQAPIHFQDMARQAKENGISYGKFIAKRDSNLTKVEIPSEKRKELKSANMRLREGKEK